MRIIHVLRKPLMESSVAANVLAHGCGALNIDLARISFKGEQSPSVERRDAAAKTGKAGRVTSGDNMQEGHIFAASKDPEEALASYILPKSGEFKGRWPANVVLEHAGGCVIVGVRELPANKSTERGWHTAYVGGEKNKVVETQTLGDADGMDRSDLWECVEGCPAADLDVQSGFPVTPTSVTRGGKRGMEFGMCRTLAPGVSGGASRFFFQFRRRKG